MAANFEILEMLLISQYNQNFSEQHAEKQKCHNIT